MKYDVFISYRRVGGKEYARTLKPELEKRGFRVFLDFDELNDGVFDQRIKDAIRDSSVFLLILSKGALDRCINKGDWVREEILHAKECGCHMIPVEFDKTFREIPDTTPEDISAIIGAHSWAQIDTETLLQMSIDEMVKKRIAPYIHREDAETGAEIHIDVDADCDLFRFNTFVRQLKADKDNVIHLKPGEYKLDFVSVEFPEVKERRIREIEIGKESYYIEVLLKDKVKELKATRKAKEEAKHKEEEGNQRNLNELEKLKLKRIRKNEKYGFADESGKIVIPCQWQWASDFSEGLARIQDDSEKCGFIDKTGKVVIPCTWKYVCSFTEGLAAVLDESLKWGYIDKTGKVVIPCKWAYALSFHKGMADVEEDSGKWWKINKRLKIDTTGKIVK